MNNDILHGLKLTSNSATKRILCAYKKRKNILVRMALREHPYRDLNRSTFIGQIIIGTKNDKFGCKAFKGSTFASRYSETMDWVVVGIDHRKTTCLALIFVACSA